MTDSSFTAVPLSDLTPRQASKAHFEPHPTSMSNASGLSLHTNDSQTRLAQHPSTTFPIQRDFAKPSRPVSPSLNEKIPPLSRNTTAGYSSSRGRSPYGKLAEAQISDPNLLFAPGDFGTSETSRKFLTVLSNNIVVRWILFIVPITILLWIPGIVWIFDRSATVWDVKLLYWSIYLTVLYAGYWAALATARIFPRFLKHTLGVVAPELKHYIEYLIRIEKPLAVIGWAVTNWIVFNVVINKNGSADKSQGSGRITNQIVNFWFGAILASAVWTFEKLVIQAIARNFHKTSFEDKISEQKFQIRVLTKLYVNSRDIGRSDTLDGAKSRSASPTASRVFKQALGRVKRAAQLSATPLGLLASEIAGERVLQPTSPAQTVASALSSQNKSRQLARRLFFSFRAPHTSALQVLNISRMFTSLPEAQEAFQIFDKDGNGDATLDEMEMACVDLHRERLALASSMRDLDSAVGRLDSILMSVVYVIGILIIVGVLDVSFSTLIASAGTFILGLSWLIGTTAQEVLLSCIFLFAKHPYDCGDRVDIDDVKYVVKQMDLLSTRFKRLDGTVVQMPHTLLNTKAISNIRRSGAISETFTWNVDYGTTFEQIEQLREKMLDFLEAESRDFTATFDCSVTDLGDQGKLVLTCAIKYKTNWQNSALQTQRRNKWICALRVAMASIKMYGPSGAGNPSPDVDVTHVKMMPNEPPPAFTEQAQPRFDPQRAVPNFAAQSNVIADEADNVFDGPAGRSIDETARTTNDPSMQVRPEASRSEQIRQNYLTKGSNV